MASSGSFNTKAYEDRYLTFSWKQESQSFSNNSTTISWQLKGAGGSPDKYYNSGNFKVVIEGETVYSSSTAISLKHQVVASGTKTIYHNTDGKKTFSASASAGIYAYTSDNSKGSGSWALNQIARQAYITSAPNFNDEQNPTIQYSNAIGNTATTLNACIADSTGKSILVPYRDISKTGTSYTFNLTSKEREALRNYCNNSNSKTVKFYLHTVISGKEYYSNVSKTLTIINAKPTISPTTEDTNQKTLELTGNKKHFIRYKSDMKVAVNAKSLKGATIVSYKIVNKGKTITNSTGSFIGVESGETVFSATDSRGNVVSKTVKDTIYNYVKPTVSISKCVLEADGTMKVNFSGYLYNGTFGKKEGNENKHYAYIRTKQEHSSEWGSWQSVSNKLTLGKNQDYTVSAAITGFNYQQSYIIQAAIEDSFGLVHTDDRVVISHPIFDWGKEDFRFLCPTVSGAVYSLGGVPQQNFIPSGGDLNKYTKAGVYCINHNEYMETVKNIPPTKAAGKLIVYATLGKANNTGKWSHLIQEFIPYDGTGSFIRQGQTKEKETWTFLAWSRTLNTGNTDYIVSQGSSGAWTYRKWNKGKAECWGKFNHAGTATKDFQSKDVALPFTFKSRQPAIISTTGTGGWAKNLPPYDNKITDMANIRITYRNAGAEAMSSDFVVYVSGFWK